MKVSQSSNEVMTHDSNQTNDGQGDVMTNNLQLSWKNYMLTTEGLVHPCQL